MSIPQECREELRARMRRAVASAEEDSCGAYVDPRDLASLLDALDAAEAQNLDEVRALAAITVHSGQDIQEAARILHSVELAEAEARLKAVQDVLDDNTVGSWTPAAQVLNRVRRALDA